MAEQIKVTVKTLDAQERKFTLSSQMLVKEFKEHIAGSVGIPPERQRLIFQGQLMLDQRRLGEYNINGNVLHLVERPPPRLAAADPLGTPASTSTAGGSEAGPSNYRMVIQLDDAQGAAHGAAAQLRNMLLSQGVGVMILMRGALSSSTSSVASSSSSRSSLASDQSSTSTVAYTTRSITASSTASSDAPSTESSDSRSTASSDTLSLASSSADQDLDSSRQSFLAAWAPFSELLENILMVAGSRMLGSSGLESSVFPETTPGVARFFQGLMQFFQRAQQPHLRSAQRSYSAPELTSTFSRTWSLPASTTMSNPERVGSRTPQATHYEILASILQRILCFVMDSAAGQPGSIADFIRCRGGSLQAPSTGGAVGFFQSLLSLLCDNFSLDDIVTFPFERIQPQLTLFFREELLHNQEATEINIQMATDNMIKELEEPVRETFAPLRVLEGVDITQTILGFLQVQFNRIARHILHCTDRTFGPRLLELCNQGLYQLLSLNRYCLREEIKDLATIICDVICLMLKDLDSSLLFFIATMIGCSLSATADQVPATEDQILWYIRRTGKRRQPSGSTAKDGKTMAPQALASTSKEAPRQQTSPQGAGAASPRTEAAEPGSQSGSSSQESVPITHQSIQTAGDTEQTQEPGDSSPSGIPAKRLKVSLTDGPPTSLYVAVKKAAEALGVTPVTDLEHFRKDLQASTAQDSYRLQEDIKKRLSGDPISSTSRGSEEEEGFVEEAGDSSTGTDST